MRVADKKLHPPTLKKVASAEPAAQAAPVEAKKPAAADAMGGKAKTTNALDGQIHGHTPLPSLSFGDANAKLDVQPTRTWQRDGDDVHEVPTRASRAHDAKLPPETKYKPTSEKALSKAVEAAHAKHAELLAKGVSPTLALVMPEDGSVTAAAFHMAALGSDQTGIEFPIAMAKLGEVEGFRVVLRVEEWAVDRIEKRLVKEKLGNVTLVPVKTDGMTELDFWSEDQGELHVDGSLSVPRSLKQGEGVGFDVASRSAMQARLDRLHPGTGLQPKTPEEWAKVNEKYPDIRFSVQGAVSERGGQRAIAAVAIGAGRPLVVTNGYSEGGNSLVGVRANGTPYAVIGQDSLVMSKLAIEKDVGHAITDAEARAYLAKDFGVAADQLAVVEQPGDFHIDMHMMLLPGGVAVVNEPLEVFALQKQWMKEDLAAKEPKPLKAGATKAQREEHQYAVEDYQSDVKAMPERLKEMEETARAQSQATARMAADLEKSGLTVKRMAGVFPFAYGEPPMNFLNGEMAKNSKGEGFGVLLGGDPRAEQYVMKKLLGELPSGLSRLHFLDRELTATTLNAMGGLSCRSKLEGTLPG